MERAEQVLSEAMIDSGLASDRRVGHSRDGGRDRIPRHPAKEDRRGEPDQVGHDAAADRDERVVPSHALLESAVRDLRDRVERLLLLRVFDLHVENQRRREDRPQPVRGRTR